MVSSQSMSSSSTAAAGQRPKEDKIALKTVSLTALMKRRAHEQFASVKAGQGPIPTGQRTFRNATTVKTMDANPANMSPSALGPKVTPTLRTKSSTVNLKVEREGETSATGMPRTLRARPSNANLRAAPTSLNTRSPNVPVDSTKSSKEISAQISAKKASQLDDLRGKGSKQQNIANSPVMSAMLRSRLPQKTITNDLRRPARSAQMSPPSQINSGFEGGGMKVKGTPSKTTLGDRLVNRASPTSSPNLRVKPAPEARTPIIRQYTSKATPAPYSPAPPLSREGPLSRNAGTTSGRPVVVKSTTLRYQG